MPTPIWGAELRDGKLFLDRREEFDAWLGAQRNGRREFVVRDPPKRIGKGLRGYFHGVVLRIFARHTGRSIPELKAIVKLKYLWDGESVDRFGFPEVPSTESLTDEQYWELIEHVRQLAATDSCYIPDPNEAEA